MTIKYITRLVAFAAILVSAGAATAQSVRINTDDDWCTRDDDWNDDGNHYCEVREVTLDGNRDVIRVDASPNGGIRVHGWDKDQILVRAKVVANAKSENDAHALARNVRLDTDGTIKADGPKGGRHEWFSVSFEVFAPANSNVDLESMNGGISISNLSGQARFETTNGGIHLEDLAGKVSGKTTNGGISIDLDGDHWDGDGLNVETVNGGVKIMVPENYSADLETSTVNGKAEIDFPVMIEGRFDRHLSAKLGDGGRRIRAVTTNGGVLVTRG
ncbi:MAG: DUF4097 family beta strand repeat-containing protein [Rhodothermales bacterium]